MRIAITGANSEVAQGLALELKSAGHQVLGLGRGSIFSSQFDLTTSTNVLPSDIDVLIHLAWDWVSDESKAELRNISNLLPLIKQAHDRRIKLILLSTSSVQSRDVSNYGRLKFKLETEFGASGGSIVRAGLIWGSHLSGVLRSISRLAMVPFICLHTNSKETFSFSHIKDVAGAIMNQFENKESELVSCESTYRLSLDEISHLFRGKNLTALNWHPSLTLKPKLAIWLIELLNRMGFHPSVRADSLKALLTHEKHEQVVPCWKSKFTQSNLEEWIALQVETCRSKKAEQKQ
jgi:dTDP-4-dehydrorhamnose reductase